MRLEPSVREPTANAMRAPTIRDEPTRTLVQHRLDCSTSSLPCRTWMRRFIWPVQAKSSPAMSEKAVSVLVRIITAVHTAKV
jgi:hypothetical protein